MIEYREVAEGYRVGDDGTFWSRWARGRIRRLTDTWRRVPGSPGPRGHIRVTFNGETRFIHQLVLEAFRGPCPAGMEGCHFPDPDPSNNNLWNLQWATRKTNSRHSQIHGRHVGGKYLPRTDGVTGGAHPRASISDATAAEVSRLNYECGWGSLRISKHLGISRDVAANVLRGKTYREATGRPAPKGVGG